MQFENKSWRVESPAEIPAQVINDFQSLIHRISDPDQRWGNLEHFKSHFARAGGVSWSRSSSESWADSDLRLLMDRAAANAPLFIEAFYEGWQRLGAEEADLVLPRINAVLSEHDAGFQIQDGRLVATRAYPAVPTPPVPESLDAQARASIEAAFRESDQALQAGRCREAVNGVLWVLETFATVYRGSAIEGGTIQGRYFNVIVRELRGQGTDTHQNFILQQMMALHGFLSSPTGGGVRHGMDVTLGRSLSPADARTYCNLIRSFIGYLMDVHQQRRA